MVYNNPQMDLSNGLALVSCNAELNKSYHGGSSNTTLSLDCFSYGGNREKSRDQNITNAAPDDGCRLVLGLGPTPTVYSNDYFSTSKKPVSESNKGLSCEGDSVLKLGLSDHCVMSMSDLDTNTFSFTHKGNNNRFEIPIDEGSTSAKKSGGYMPSLLLAPRMQMHNLLEPSENSSHVPQLSSELSAMSDYSMGTMSDHQTSNSKKCKFEGCTKGARGATGLCIGHGGGQRCQKPGCNKGAESRTAYCKAHGGGRRCQHLGCTKSAEGRTEYCIAHGGGRRCGHSSGCSKAARGKSGLCIKHGGGKRCKVEGCTRSAEGQVGLCISHGGGRRCQFQGCNKGAQGSTMYCKAHGGGKRCIFAGCTKGAEGSTPLCKAHGGGKRCLYDGGGICPKSVHGGTNFCVAHGGGKRCSVPGCTKSARGRTDCCVKHGGGKRCKSENCTKSAQGSTDFCKAHGGGKRCNWGGEGNCEKFARGKNGLCAAHASMVQDRESNASKKGSFGKGIGPGLFHGLVPAPASTIATSFDNTYSSSGVSIVSDSIDSLERPAKRQQLIPPQVLVPPSMKSAFSSYTTQMSSEKIRDGHDNGSSKKSLEFTVPEGRVHGGGLLSLLGGNLKNATVDGV
uniref:loricrin-like n=1 Tax=Erigeron canadensis TaxID=72917 RepID=UPI001CB9CA16|nr:loricrin-like [Erigeron canadensis]